MDSDGDAPTPASPSNGGPKSPALDRPQRPTQTPALDEDQPGPLPYLRRQPTGFRKNSVQSDVSSRRSFLTAESTDSLLLPRVDPRGEQHDEPSLWYSAPLLFAILPALGGVLFKRGSIFLTDLALLTLAALYLNWCLVTPWIWYRSAQAVKVETSDDQDLDLPESAEDELLDDTIDSITNGGKDKRRSESSNPLPPQKKGSKSDAALNELRMHEVTALALCFLGPLLGSYVLHLVRLQLSTLSDQLVSNLHLTLFVLGAEIRPLRLAIKMAQSRTLYLQRIVQENPHAALERKQSPEFGEMQKRMDELESSYAEHFSDIDSKRKAPDTTDAMKKLHGSMQTQIDTLNRATRRYEKRATVQAMQTEARLQELDTRLKEAVSLAAAAANYSQKPGIVLLALTSTQSLFKIPLVMAYNVVVYPVRLASQSLIQLALACGLVQTRPRKPSRPTVRSKTAPASVTSRRALK